MSRYDGIYMMTKNYIEDLSFMATSPLDGSRVFFLYLFSQFHKRAIVVSRCCNVHDGHK